MALTKDEKWNAVVHCDHSYDGLFFYGVKTTGIFCRPSCKSKEPLRNNVTFFDKITEAYDCGLRPCKRCRPDLLVYRPMLDLIEKAKHSMDTYFTDRQRLVAEIKKLGISQNHLIHLFRQQYHMTPVEYITTLRVEKARQMLRHTDTKIVTIALLCGFGSLSNFYGFFKKQIGLTPSEYRKQSRGDAR
jgi:AraC family transcriptional regulator of adaptative response / methylphosphotriester-DNA alkyltransferase methyltransferase